VFYRERREELIWFNLCPKFIVQSSPSKILQLSIHIHQSSMPSRSHFQQRRTQNRYTSPSLPFSLSHASRSRSLQRHTRSRNAWPSSPSSSWDHELRPRKTRAASQWPKRCRGMQTGRPASRRRPESWTLWRHAS